jgi:hypothetical protein
VIDSDVERPKTSSDQNFSLLTGGWGGDPEIMYTLELILKLQYKNYSINITVT